MLSFLICKFYSIEREVFKPFFTFLILDLNIGQKNENLSRQLFTLLPYKLF